MRRSLSTAVLLLVVVGSLAGVAVGGSEEAVGEETSQVEAASAPTEDAPALAEGVPAPTEGAPAPTEGAPAPTEGAPAPTEGAPAPTEDAPALAEGAPAPTEDAPALAEGAPAPAEAEAAPSPETEIAAPPPDAGETGEGAVTPSEDEPPARTVLLQARIASVEVAGNQRIPTEDILAAIESKVGEAYSEQQVDRDRRAVLNLGWFHTVAVERESVETGIRLVFRVSENPVVAEIQFQGNRELTTDELRSVMQTKTGDVFSWPRWRQDGDAIYELYRSKGFILATVLEPVMTSEGVLTVSIYEGVIEDINITGNTHTKTYVIRRYIRTRVGDTYDDKKAAADVGRLAKLGWFETVRHDVEMGTETGKVILMVTVVEKKRTGLATVGAGYTSVQGLVGFVDLVKTNLRGTGQMATIRAEFGGRTSYEFGYRHPWVMDPETRLSLGIYDRLILREAFVSEEGIQRSIFYDERRSGGNITLGRPLSDRTTIYFGVRRDDVSISGLNPEEATFLTGPAFEPREVRSFTLAAVTDARDNPYDPRRGSYQQLSAEFAGILGGVDFNKYTAEHRRYLPVSKRNVLAMRLLLGVTTGDAPYLEQFLIGGPESLRGFRTDRFAGSRLAILNTEYRFPLTSNLIGVVFVDVGDAWGGPLVDDPFFHGDASFTAHVGYGAGVRVKTPIGPIRLDLGFSEEGTETHFGVSHMF